MNNTSNNVNSTFPKTQKKIVVTEKPSIANSFAEVLGVTECGYEWRCGVANRTKVGTGCPRCNGKVR